MLMCAGSHIITWWCYEVHKNWIHESPESADFGRLINSLLLCWITGVSGFYGTSSLKSILRHSVFFTVQLSYLYMTTGKTIALILRTVVGRVMALLFNMLPRFEIAFLSWNKHLLNSPSSVRPNPARSLKSGRLGQTSNDAKWSTAVNAREHRRGSGWPAFPLSSCTRFTVASSSCLLV